MNTNFVNIIKRIIAEQGDDILANPQRLKGYVADYAAAESKAERLAFSKCIEAGAYNELKDAPDAAARQAVKTALAQRVHSSEGLDLALCNDALDALEAGMIEVKPLCQKCGKELQEGWKMCPFCGEAQTAAAAPAEPALSSENAEPAPEAAVPEAAAAVEMPPPMSGAKAIYCTANHTGAKTAFSISKKTALFGAAAGGGALVGYLIWMTFRDSLYTNNIVAMAIWDMGLGLGISVGLFIIQTLSAKRKPDTNLLIKTILIGLASGMVSSGFAQFIYYTQDISTAVMIVTMGLSYGVTGAGLGFGASFYVPNYPPKRAVLAGAAGGTLGGIIAVALPSSGSNAGSIIGVIILGAAIGLAISFIEEALREAWLTIIWSKNEMTTVSLGGKPIVAGSTREADIYLPRHPSEPAVPVRAVFSIENGAVVVDDRLTGTRRQSQNGERIDLGRVSVIVNTKAQ